MKDVSFIQYLNQSGISEQTCRTYNFHIEKIRAIQNPDELEYSDIINLVSHPDYSLRYRQVIVAALKQYFNYLIWLGKRSGHPCLHLRIRSNFSKNYLQQDFLSEDELALIRNRKSRYSLLDKRDKVLFSLLTVQGLTPTELSSLNVSDVRLSQAKINVRASRKYKLRSLNLLSEQVHLINEYLLVARPKLMEQDERALLIGMNGERVTTDTVHYLISTLKGLFPDKKLTPLMVRQSVISWWINKLKIPPEQVQLMTGHRWLSSTQKYEFRDPKDDLMLVNRWQ